MSKITAWSEENVSLTALRDRQYQPSNGIDVPDRLFAQNSRGISNGTMNLTLFTPTRTMTVSNITVASLTGASDGSGTTVRKMGLFTVNGLNVTCVARTANKTSLLTANSTLYPEPFTSEAGYSSSYTLLAGTTYACGLLCYNTGGTYGTPSVAGFQNANPTLSTITPYVVLSASSQTDITNTTVTAGTGAGGSAWFRLT